MKALTLTQPWASLVAIGAKSIETRSWGTHHRGPLAIHAAKGFPAEAVDFALFQPECRRLMEAHGFWRPGDGKALRLPRGEVAAVCKLVTCIRLDDDLTVRDVLLLPSAAPHERAFGDYALGRFAWVLGDIHRLPEPIPARGALGLWEWDAPASALALLPKGGA